MKHSALTLFPVLLLAAACGGSGSSGAASEVASAHSSPTFAPAALPGNAEILSKTYDPDYDVPPDFFVDERAETTTRSYTVHHVLDASNSYERCTNDLVVAQQWEQEDNAARAVNGYYVASIENDRYFEFVRELDYTQDVGSVADPTSPGYARVFKCDYADRSGVDRNLLDGYSGRLMARPASAAALQEFTEYMWQFRFFNVSRKAVIASYGEAGANGLTHTLLLALVHNQGVDRCDRVDVVEWRFSFDETAREMRREFHTARSFEAELRDGIPQFCD